jgi:hypothetical protein
MKNQGTGRVTEERKRQVGQFFMGTDDKKAAWRQHFDDPFDGGAQCRLLIIGQILHVHGISLNVTNP